MYQPRLGDPLDALDTPAMIVDLPLTEKNIASLMERFRGKGTHVNLHDYYYAYRDGRLEAIWSIEARGKVQ